MRWCITPALRFGILVVLSLVLSPPSPAHGTTGEEALRHMRILADEIGPRKTGTEAERRAVEHVRQAMEAAGLEVRLEEVATVGEAGGAKRVGSWNVIGELPGPRRDTIVLAAHHDTKDVSVPGANDDASAVGVLLEVARRTASRPRRASFRFVSFCAEEEGLLGSRHHAGEADLSSLRAMVALELIGRGELFVAGTPRPAPLWAQRALLRAARGAGVVGVGARPLWTLAPRLLDLPYSADHEPFLDRGVPSFLIAGVFPGWAYHTAEDTPERIDPANLGRAVALVDRLLRNLEDDLGIGDDDPHYLSLTLSGRGWLVRSDALRMLAAAALAAWVVFALLRAREVLAPRAFLLILRVVAVTTAATVLAVSGPFATAWIMERVHGLRFPWMAHQPLHLALAGAALCLNGWLALNLFRRIKPTVNPAPYLHAALFLPAVGAAAGWGAGWPETAMFAAVPLVSFLLSLRVENIGRKAALGMLGVLPLFLLITPGEYRVLVDLAGIAPPRGLLFVIVVLAALPFVLFLAHVAAFQDCLHSRAWWWLSGWRVGLAALAACCGLGMAAAWLPAYDTEHRQVVRLQEDVDLDERNARVRVSSADNLGGFGLRGGATSLASVREAEIDLPFPEGMFLLEASLERPAAPDPRLARCRLALRAPVPVDRITYTFTSAAGLAMAEEPERRRQSYALTVVARQEEAVEVVDLILPEGGDLALEVVATFVGDLLQARPLGTPAQVVVPRTVVRARRQLAPTADVPETPGPPPASDAPSR